MKKNTFLYSCLSTARNKGKPGNINMQLFSSRLISLFSSHHLLGNFFHYRTAIKILGLDYNEVFEQGRLDLNINKWADFGPLNFQLGPPRDSIRQLRSSSTAKNLTNYPPNIIPELKEISAKVVFKRECGKYFEIIATEGAQAALAYCILTFVNPKDEVIITDPGYFFLEPPIILAGGKVKRIPLSEKNNYRIDLESLKKQITKHTKVIIVCDPINPFGTVQEKKQLEGIVDIANKHNIIILNNITHSFHRISSSIKHYPMSALRKKDLRNVITISGLSHGYGLAGLRIGFLGGKPELLEAVLATKSALTRINISLPTQYAAIAALKDNRYIKRCDALLKINFLMLKEIINNVSPLSFVVEPEYGFFACIDTSKVKASCQELTVALLKRKCAVYSSDGLGNQKYTSYIRINFSTPHKKHFIWLQKALPEAIKEAETRKYRKAVVDFFRSVGTQRARKVIKELYSK